MFTANHNYDSLSRNYTYPIFVYFGPLADKLECLREEGDENSTLWPNTRRSTGLANASTGKWYLGCLVAGCVDFNVFVYYGFHIIGAKS